MIYKSKTVLFSYTNKQLPALSESTSPSCCWVLTICDSMFATLSTRQTSSSYTLNLQRLRNEGRTNPDPQKLWRSYRALAIFASLCASKLKPAWNDRSISLSYKIRLMCSLVTSTFLNACESWTLTAGLQRRIQAMDMRCYRKILRISYKDHVTNEKVRARSSRQLDHTKTSWRP